MEKKRMVHEEGLLRIFFVLVVLFLCISDCRKHPTPDSCDEIISQEPVQLRTPSAVPVVCTSPETIPMITDGTDTLVTDSTDTLNATTGASNTTDLPDSISTETTPSEPGCLQGWAIFLICLGAVVTVFLLAGIPIMVYCILQSRQLSPQTCPFRYNCKIYTAPEEQAFQLE